jgi:hypothetical protein
MGWHGPTEQERRRGKAAIEAIRSRRSLLPRRANPFRHDHDADEPCLLCGYDEHLTAVQPEKNPAA